jgi:FAS-associated factor 2
MAHALGLGFNAVTLVGNLILPASIKQQLQALAASLSQRMEGMTGELAARTFKNSFTLHYGQPQPHWLECGWQQAAAQAHAGFKFLFIYLHAPDHQDTDAFCKGVLQSSEVLEYIDNQFLCWGGDIRHTDAWRLSMAVQASSYPYVGLMAFSGSRTRLVAASEGLCTPAQLLTMLRDAVNQYGAEFVADQAEASQVELNRRLREEQDAEYEAGLRADQERERKRQEEEQQRLEQQRAAEQAEAEQRAAAEAEAKKKADAETELRQRKADKRNALQPEPESSTAQVASIRVRLPDGSNAQRRFHAHAKLQAVYDFVDSQENLSSLKYSLATNFPRMEYGSDKLQQSLEELKLTPSAMLLVQYITD